MSEPEKPAEKTEAELITEFIDWVNGTIHEIESVAKNANDRFWCPDWWQHPEAINRFRALYDAYQIAAAEGQMSSWWIQHWDAHARILFSQNGPFKDCRERHRFEAKADKYTPRLVTTQPPPEWEP